MKKKLKQFLQKSRILKNYRVNNQLLILNYHRLIDPKHEILFDEGVFGPNGERFQQEMEWLKQETRILSEEELIDIIHNNRKVDQICSMVTFDDGYIDNYNIAYPILKKLSIPAIYFIPTKHMNDRSLGWWDIAAYLVKNSKLSKTCFRERNWNLTNKDNIIAEVILELKKMEPSRVDIYLKELAISLDVQIPSIEIQGREIMTWEQIKEVSNNGITIGSHTHEHVILSKQPLDQMRFQIQKSKDILEEKLNKKMLSIAYPVGGYDHFDIETKKISKELGFKLGFSFNTGVNRFGNIDPFDVRRGSSHPDWHNLDFPLAFPDRIFQSSSKQYDI